MGNLFINKCNLFISKCLVNEIKKLKKETAWKENTRKKKIYREILEEIRKRLILSMRKRRPKLLHKIVHLAC